MMHVERERHCGHCHDHLDYRDVLVITGIALTLMFAAIGSLVALSWLIGALS